MCKLANDLALHESQQVTNHERMSFLDSLHRNSHFLSGCDGYFSTVFARLANVKSIRYIPMR